MAGDRRATAGNIISKRDMRKVFEADGWSGMGISGSAGPAMEMARIFATELEHYEKVEGSPLSLEGKANKLSQMVRGNLGMALQGFVVVPLFAGFDPVQEAASIYEFDAAGGRYEERRFASTGSGGRDARGSLKARYREGLSETEAVDLVIEALWDAADEDSATGGPDLVRGIYPLVAMIDDGGYRELDDEDVATRVETVIAEPPRRPEQASTGVQVMAMPFYVPVQQQQREKAEFARQGISRGRSLVALTYDDGVVFVAENPSATLRKTSEIYDRIGFGAVGKYSEYEELRVAGIRQADVRGYQYSRQDVTGRTLANAYANFLNSVFTQSPKPLEVELLLAEVTDGGAELYHIFFDGSVTDEERFVGIGGESEGLNDRLRDAWQADLDLSAAVRAARTALTSDGGEPLRPDQLEVSGLDRTRGRRTFFRLPDARIATLLDGQG